MELPKSSPEGESTDTKIICLIEHAEGAGPIYHFWENGEEIGLTLTRETVDARFGEYAYGFIFFGWEFASAGIHPSADGSVDVEWLDIVPGLDEEQQAEAERLIPGSLEFLVSALKTDFPETTSVIDIFGQPFIPGQVII